MQRGDLILNGLLPKFNFVHVAADNALQKVGLIWFDWNKFKDINDYEPIYETDKTGK
jgi:hypothetical protein